MKSILRSLPRTACAGALLMAMGTQSSPAATVVFNLETATFEDIQKAMDAGALTAVELATLYLNRRDVYDQAGMKLNSVVAISPTLFEDAAASDQRRANGELLSPIDGIPFVTKDSYNTAGMATTGGIAGWVDMIADTDCPVVDKLRDSGAILLGHANMDRFATSASSTVSEPYGTTLNAYTLGSAAGSSGGPAVATGANFAGFGFGGETGGSIRNPSDRAGVVGYKVGVGTVPIGGILALVPDRDVIGPMTRYAEDNAKVMDVAAFDDPTDIWATVDYTPGRPKAGDFLTKAGAASLAGKRVGVIGTYVGIARPSPAPTPIAVPGLPTNVGSSSNTTTVNTPSAEIGAIFNRARAELEALGAEVVTVFLPPNVDTAVGVGDGMPTRALYTGSNGTYAQAWAHKTFLEGLGQDPVLRLTQAGRAANLINAVASNTILTFTSEPGVEHFAAQAIINRRFEAWMDAEGIDVLVWPTHVTKSRTSGTNPGRDLVNNIGLPCVTVPMGVIPSTGEPVTMAFVGKYRGDADVLAYASAYEKATNYRIPSPLAPPLEGETIVYTVPDEPVAAAAAKSGGADKLGPVVTVATTAKIVGSGKKSKLKIDGVAVDAGSIRSLKVYVNGRKVPAKLGKKWQAAMPVSQLKKLIKPKDSTVDVTVMAKDSEGNTSATRKTIKLGTLLTDV